MIKKLIKRGIGAGMPLLILTTVISAEEMDHSQHQMVDQKVESSEQKPVDHSQHQMAENAEQKPMDHSQHQMTDSGEGNMNMMDHSQHASHDTGSAKHIHHEHGKSGWMIEYKFMRMEMDGLLEGSNKVSTEDVSGTQMQMGMGMVRLPGKGYMMAPTKMTMDMHMLMGMYGFSQNFSMMFMGQYLDNDMDMEMQTYGMAGNRTPQNDTRPGPVCKPVD